MKKETEISISKRLNAFIESLNRNVHCVRISKISDTETVIEYEDWDAHPPIRNFRPDNESVPKQPSLSINKGPKSPETKAKISKSMQGKDHSYYARTKQSAKIGRAHV